MTKIAYNTIHGGFSLSEAGTEHYLTLKGWKWRREANEFTMKFNTLMGGHAWIVEDKHFSCRNVPRDDPSLIATIETLGREADGRFARLAVRELPPGTKYRIDEYDGAESVMTVDEYEWETA